MQQFKKLNLQIPSEYSERRKNCEADRILGRHEKINDNEYRSIRRYMSRSRVEAFKNCLPKALLPYVSGVTTTEITLLPPHVHTKELCIINFYQKTFGEVTTFYDGEVKAYETETQGACNGYFLCRTELLKPADSFIANEGSVYLLNARAPHCVSEQNDSQTNDDKYKPIRKEKRVIVQAFFDLPFDEVASHFSESA